MTQMHPETHSHLGWRPATGFGFVRRMAMVPLAAAEIARVAQALPVVFHKAGARWVVIAVMGCAYTKVRNGSCRPTGCA